MMLNKYLLETNCKEFIMNNMLSWKKLYAKILVTKIQPEYTRHFFITSVIHINGQVHLLSVKFNRQ